MKRLNILQVFIVAFTLSMIVSSCSKDIEEIDEPIQKNSLKKRSEESGSFILNSIDKIINDSVEQDFSDLELNQKTLDYYGDLFGVSEESLNVEMAEKIVVQVKNIMNNGIDNFLKRTKFSAYTKEKIKTVFSGKLLTGIEKEEEFLALINEEQTLLLTLHSIALESYQEINNQNRGCTINGIPAPCGAAGAIIGLIVGINTCGIPCGIGGAIIGGVIGAASKR
ncbi:hypothetical protein [Aquimarina sp. 2201CG5-10]|uniref:hypothetical protein n=1 Tax=Aquimarina callyspongiae TaxID=3098150 RepID=UPI002AB5BC85|nr:hypothetical protein [Aquimarina sp. 2201CG5-10]MDY8136712.1 hypothetical protein [Aquimarina sp. 2201CG5-10]